MHNFEKQEKRALKNILVSGGAGFIGSNFIRYLFGFSEQKCEAYGEFCGRVINVDHLSYAANLGNLEEIDAEFGVKRNGKTQARYILENQDISNSGELDRIFKDYAIDTVIHFAAETHVDRSILGPEAFVRNNVSGTLALLEAARKAWTIAGPQGPRMRKDVLFHHISTDEVYGSLGPEGRFNESSPYRPRSPYSASKAASDHLVRAWYYTYALPLTLSNCSNNYGPYQFPEKFIPLMILNMLESKPLPVYGDGKNRRDWVYVEDHNSAVWAIVNRGTIGEIYAIGGEAEWENLRLLESLIELVAKHAAKSRDSLKALVSFVADRPGHDKRYAIDCEKIKKELGWTQTVSFDEGLEKTVRWYLSQGSWIDSVRNGEYKTWLERNYSGR